MPAAVRLAAATAAMAAVTIAGTAFADSPPTSRLVTPKQLPGYSEADKATIKAAGIASVGCTGKTHVTGSAASISLLRVVQKSSSTAAAQVVSEIVASTPSDADARAFLVKARATAAACRRTAATGSTKEPVLLSAIVGGVPRVPGANFGFSQHIVVASAETPNVGDSVQELDYQVGRFVVIVQATLVRTAVAGKTASTSLSVPASTLQLAVNAARVGVHDVLAD